MTRILSADENSFTVAGDEDEYCLTRVTSEKESGSTSRLPMVHLLLEIAGDELSLSVFLFVFP